MKIHCLYFISEILCRLLAYERQKIELIPADSIFYVDLFGILKEDYRFKRFLTRGKQNIEIQFFLLAFAFNIEKLCNRAKKERKGQHLFRLEED